MASVGTLAEHMQQLNTAPDPGQLKQALRAALQTAIELEFSTIPPYLTAFWSIKAACPAKTSLRAIFKEEMLHLGLACNMLRSIGGWPELSSPGVVPSYPIEAGYLPGGIHPDLTVALEGFGPSALRTFLRIEFPRQQPVALTPAEAAEAAALGGVALGAQGAASIGAFYDAVRTAFGNLAPTDVSADGQVEDADDFDPPLAKVATPAAAQTAIDIITKQGEGSAASPDSFRPGELSHYYQFGQMATGKTLTKTATPGEYEYADPPIPIPGPADVWPVGPIPAGGFPEQAVDPTVFPKLAEFDDAYKGMLKSLQDAWGPGDQATRNQALQEAINAMGTLTPLAKALMAKPLSDGSGKHSAPCFRVI